MKYSTFFLFLLTFYACSSEQTAKEQPKDLKTEILGTWQGVSIDVKVNSANGTDSTDVFQVNENNWARKLGMQPSVLRFYQEGNKYTRQFINPAGVPIDTMRGMWNIFGDTLMLIEPTATYQYSTTLENGLLKYRAMIDWDGDGLEDDEYEGVDRKVSKYVH